MNIGDSLPDMAEHTCLACKNVFYTLYQPELPSALTKPSYCPFCGTEFTWRKPTEETIA